MLHAFFVHTLPAPVYHVPVAREPEGQSVIEHLKVAEILINHVIKHNIKNGKN